MAGVIEMVAESGKNMVAKRLAAVRNADARFNLKSCPRCRGDLFLEFEDQIFFAKCLQCSRSFEVGAGRELWQFLYGKSPEKTAA